MDGFCTTFPPCTLNSDNSISLAGLQRGIVSVNESQIVILGEKNEILVTYDRQEIIAAESGKDATRKQHIIHYFTPKDGAADNLNKYKGETVTMLLTSEIKSEDNEMKNEVLSLKLKLLKN